MEGGRPDSLGYEQIFQGGWTGGGSLEDGDQPPELTAHSINHVS